ncbi:alpha,alpha-trehalose-phosphate synthase (UDP-forming) [Psychrobacter sp. KCTC 72983]|uniref:alpha,alpha-trehalose-phosphate synthase (UDP-forming) n=1 Tax=Psychrobacter sp. KCTC 72983 TaxID=2733866 RepID=UPI00164403F4|nr:trehalose-6-phosphate synthase [Psychrobacter sp. KCTC 72983]
MSRLIALSNRVKLPDNGPMAGGLAVALHEVLKGHSVVWMGWNGEVEDAPNTFHQQEQTVTSTDSEGQKVSSQITYVTTALTPKQYQHYYCGFANSVLWLLLHEQPNLIHQAPEDYANYQTVNRLFAQQLQAIAQPDDVIWVHDYHFLSVAYHCRQLGMRNRIGLFLHIPFAPLLFWQPLQQSAELIYHLVHYDLLGTQTMQDKTKATAVCQHYLKDRLLPQSLADAHLDMTTHRQPPPHSNDTRLKLWLDLQSPHRLKIDAYPIGVNVARIQQYVSHLISDDPLYKHSAKSDIKQIIAVDRIDYSKGLLARFSAYRSFLQQNPRYQNQLNFLQIACPSRLDLPVYQRLYAQVRQLVAEVNQQFSPSLYAPNSLNHRPVTDNDDSALDEWQAITYSEKVLEHRQLMTMFYKGDIGWVNSLKDGMNLVAKEYIAAQDPDDPGVLLLSRYAGAAEQMQAAVIIDPAQPSSIIQGLKTALTMPLKQRQERHQVLLQGLKIYDVHQWQQRFLDDLYLSRQSKVID